MAATGTGFAVRVWQSSINNKWNWDILLDGWAHIGNGGGIATEKEARKLADERLDYIIAQAKSAKGGK